MGNVPWDRTGINCYGMGMGQINMSHGQPWLVHGNVIPMGIPWKTSLGMGRDRHKLLWDGTDKYVPWTTLLILG